MALLEDLELLRSEAEKVFGAVKDAAALEASRVDFLGNRGRLKGMLGRMSEVPKEQKPAIGKRANEIGAEIQALFDAAKSRIDAASAAAGQAVGGAQSSFEALKQERLDKLKLYQQRSGETGWGSRFPAPGSGKSLTSVEDLRRKFASLDPAQHTDPSAYTDEVYLAARVMLRRDQSKKLIFLTVQDQTGQIQVALWNTLLDEKVLGELRDALDLWDIVGISGKLAFTQKGEPTVWATSARILAKCIAPPPDKHHGIHDKEIRYRHRYLDLISDPQSRKTFILRSKAIAGLRRFLDAQGFLEVETPVLQTIPGGAAARPFKTHLNALGIDMYLRIATEIGLKKVLVGGLEKVYELGRIFRNEGVSPKHNPEFTMVEIYQAYGDLRDMMALTENAISTLAQELTGGTTVTFRGRQIKLGAPWPRRDYCELLKEHAGVSHEDVPGLEKKLREKGIDPTGMTLVDKIDGVFGEYCEPHLVDACFVINQPVEMSPLCRAHPSNPKLADRFEAFASGMEISNAYTELNDPIEQTGRLLTQVLAHLIDDLELLIGLMKTSKEYNLESEPLLDLCALIDYRLYDLFRITATLPPDRVQMDPSWKEIRDRVNADVHAEKHSGHLKPATVAYFMTLHEKTPKRKELQRALDRATDPSLLIDEDFLNAMEHGMPPAGGLGIGIDRVVMLLAGQDSIRDVILFPLMRPQTVEVKAE